MNTIYTWRTKALMVTSVFDAIFTGIALTSAKERAPDTSSEKPRTVPRALQAPAPRLLFRKMENFDIF